MIKCYECLNYRRTGQKNTCIKCKNKIIYGKLQQEIINYCGEYEKATPAERNLIDGMGVVHKKIYISGKITGNPEYKNEFEKAESIVRAAGYKAINPAKEELQNNSTWVDYMRHDLKLLCDCDGMYMLPNWKESEGAKIEHDLAVKLKIKIFYADS